MIPVDEGNDECRRCKRFDLCNGCMDTYKEGGTINKLPSCGRSVILSQKVIRELVEKENKPNGKRRIFKIMQRNRS